MANVTKAINDYPEQHNHNQTLEFENLFDLLFPILSSITGPGLRSKLNILQQYVPLKIEKVKTGEQVFDWEIPPEWHIKEAWLKDPKGNIIVNLKDNNLGVINYSMPVNKKVTLQQLQKHLYTIPNLKQAIPYVTSYYKRRWGFCLPHETYVRLEEGDYHAFIDSEYVDGELNYGYAKLPGKTRKEVLISAYLCHPSMANNELSGPVVATFLYKRLKKWPQRRFAYRFVYNPETIGSIAFLHKHGTELKKNLYSGLVLTCIGGQDILTYKKSRQDNTPIDRVILHLFEQKAIEGKIRPFIPTGGSDERQYCSPGFNLPVGQMARTKYGSYEGYHNSLDTKESMTIESLERSVDELELILRALELDGYYINLSPLGEVKLDKHGLYPDLNSRTNRKNSSNSLVDQRTQLNRILTVLNYCDGTYSLLDIAEKCNCSILDLEPTVNLLKNKKLLSGPFFQPVEWSDH